MTLDAVFRPGSVAVIGASPREGALSGRFVSELLRHGYKGRIAPVNPRYSEVFELPCFPDVAAAAAGGPVDLAVIALPRETVLGVLEACHEAGVAAALVFSSGFSEMGADGRQEEAQIRDFAKRTGFRVLGPNCAGYINIADATCLMMSSIAFRSHFFPGRVAVVAQSGGVAGIICERAQDAGLGLSMALSTGNESDVTFGEILQWLAAEEHTTVVAGYFEAVRDVGAFTAGMDALRTAGKPLVMLTAGGTGAAARATAAHTGGLATADDVLQAVFDRYGVIRVYGVDDLIDTAMGLADLEPVNGRRVGIVTTSGGVGTLAAEAAERAGLEVPPFEPDTRAALAEAVPDFAGLENPLDMTAMFQEDLSIFSKSLRVLGAANEIDVPLLCVATHSPAFADRLEGQLLEYKAECHATGAKLPIILWVAGRMSAAARERLRQHGLAVFEDPNRCMRAVKALAEIDRSPAVAPELLPDGSPAALGALAARTTEFEALEALRAVGVPAVASVHCPTGADAAEAARRVGGRVVVKASAADLLHKSDAGAVVVGVVGPEAVAEAHERVVEAAKQAGVVPDGSIVQALAPDGVELIVGARRDPRFGPVLVVAPGGLGAELTTDVARRLLPLRTGEAEAMLRELRTFPLLTGYRRQPPADLPAAVAAIEAVARFAVAAGDRLQAVEINPLIVHQEGCGASAVDGLILLEE